MERNYSFFLGPDRSKSFIDLNIPSNIKIICICLRLPASLFSSSTESRTAAAVQLPACLPPTLHLPPLSALPHSSISRQPPVLGAPVPRQQSPILPLQSHSTTDWRQLQSEQLGKMTVHMLTTKLSISHFRHPQPLQTPSPIGSFSSLARDPP